MQSYFQANKHDSYQGFRLNKKTAIIESRGQFIKIKMPLISKRHFLWLVGIAVPKLRENQRPHFDFFENKKACQILTGFAVSRDSWIPY